MTQITQTQIDEAIRQAHIERADAMAAGIQFIRNAVASSVSKLTAAIRAWMRPSPHTQS